MTSFTVYDKDTYNKFGVIAREMHGHGGINKLIWNFIKKTVDEHDGQKNGIENYFDQSFVPKPEIDADFESKILPWLRTLNDDKLHQMMRIFYPGHIFIKALQDTPQDQRLTAGFDYQMLWRQYR